MILGVLYQPEEPGCLKRSRFRVVLSQNRNSAEHQLKIPAIYSNFLRRKLQLSSMLLAAAPRAFSGRVPRREKPHPRIVQTNSRLKKLPRHGVESTSVPQPELSHIQHLAALAPTALGISYLNSAAQVPPSMPNPKTITTARNYLNRVLSTPRVELFTSQFPIDQVSVISTL